MDILDEIKELKEKLNTLELKISNNMKIDDIAVGEQFVYCGHTYTKLNKENFCIIDDYDSDFMKCQFDPISNNYDESLIRYYINSDRFIEKVRVNKADIKAHYKDDLITLLSREEYEEYRFLIKEYNLWWSTRSAAFTSTNHFYAIYSIDYIIPNSVTNTYGVRLCFKLNSNTLVEQKVNIDEEFEDKGE